MNNRCDLPGEDFIAYCDAALVDDRHEAVEAHVRSCLKCQTRLQQFDDLGRRFGEAFPLEEDPLGYTQILERIRAQTREREQHQHPVRAFKPALIIILVISILWSFFPPAVSWADFRLARLITFIDDPSENRILPANADPPGDPAEGLQQTALNFEDLPFLPVVPERLPKGLEFIDHSVPQSDILMLRYENASGLILMLSEAPANVSVVTVPRDAAGRERVGDVEVFHQTDELSGRTFRLIWERQGVIFELSTVQSLGIGLSLTDALSIVESILAAQNAL